MEDYEKKYNSAIEVMQQWIAPCHTQEQLNVLKTSVFPELKESEDEKMLKRIINIIDEYSVKHQIDNSDCIDWLERQGLHANFRNQIQIGDKVTRNETGVLINLSQLNRVAKQDKQNPAKKVEPRFKVGDKVVNDGKVCTIKIVNEDNYIVNNGERDVQVHFSYTKDWELVGQKSYWSEEDEKIIRGLIAICDEWMGRHSYYPVENCDIEMLKNWLKSLKERVQPKVELTQLDKNILEAAIAFVEQNNHFNYWCGVNKHTVLSALHSLKPQIIWKPSDEQMEALRIARDRNDKIGFYLSQLYDDLKKLM